MVYTYTESNVFWSKSDLSSPLYPRVWLGQLVFLDLLLGDKNLVPDVFISFKEIFSTNKLTHDVRILISLSRINCERMNHTISKLIKMIIKLQWLGRDLIVGLGISCQTIIISACQITVQERDLNVILQVQQPFIWSKKHQEKHLSLGFPRFSFNLTFTLENSIF